MSVVKNIAKSHLIIELSPALMKDEMTGLDSIVIFSTQILTDMLFSTKVTAIAKQRMRMKKIIMSTDR
jgi:hypothetical protein